jgi:hypothetical protein
MSDQWFYSQNNDKCGPISSDELKAMATSGRLRPDAFVWKEGLPNWIPARRVKGLFRSVGDTVPPPLPAPSSSLDLEPPPLPTCATATLADGAGPEVADCLTRKQYVLYSLAFLFIPFVCVLVSSFLFYRWRHHKPNMARQINRLGFMFFGINCLIWILMSLDSTSSDIGGVRTFDSSRGGYSLYYPSNSWRQSQSRLNPVSEI